MTDKTDTERNEAIKELEELYPSFTPDDDDIGGYAQIQSALSLAIDALCSQSEAERKIEEAIKQCKDQIQDAEDFFNGAEPENDFPEGRWKACRQILKILEGKADERK